MKVLSFLPIPILCSFKQARRIGNFILVLRNILKWSDVISFTAKNSPDDDDDDAGVPDSVLYTTTFDYYYVDVFIGTCPFEHNNNM